jgi:hypothetical protein
MLKRQPFRSARFAAPLSILLAACGSQTQPPAATPTATPAPTASGATTLNWSGREWTLRSGGGGPGPNTWDPSNVFADASGNLHLQIIERAGGWSSAELDLGETLGFGTYQCHVLGAPGTLDGNVVFGFFAYPPTTLGPDGTNEIDIEFSRWGQPRNPNGNFTAWPTISGASNSSYVFDLALPSNQQSTYRFVWTSNTITFEALNGFAPIGGEDGLYARWIFDPAHPPAATQTSQERFNCTSGQPADCIAQKPQRFIMNLWQFSGEPPSSGKTQEIVLADFVYSPL